MSDQRLDEDAETLYNAVNRLVRRYQFRDRERICCHGISVTQCYGLEWLVESGPMRLKPFADHLMLDASTASRVVNALVRKKLITRMEDPDDRRAVLLTVTDAGRSLYGTIRRELVEEERSLIADMSEAERRGAIKLLQRLDQAASRRIAPTAPSD